MANKHLIPIQLLLWFYLVSLSTANDHTGKTIHDYAVPPALDFNVRTLEGKNRHLSEYYGRVVLAVNVASECGFTPQYKDLQDLHERYQDRGLAIVGSRSGFLLRRLLGSFLFDGLLLGHRCSSL